MTLRQLATSSCYKTGFNSGTMELRMREDLNQNAGHLVSLLQSLKTLLRDTRLSGFTLRLNTDIRLKPVLELNMI